MNTLMPEQILVMPLTVHCNSIRYFNQFQVYDTFFFRCRKSAAASLRITQPSLQISKVCVMDTRVGTSLEGQTLTGNSLSVTGTLSTKLILTQQEYPCQADIVIDKTMPFSTYIVIPAMERFPSYITIGYEIQDYDALIIQDNSLYAVISLLIAYNDCEM